MRHMMFGLILGALLGSVATALAQWGTQTPRFQEQINEGRRLQQLQDLNNNLRELRRSPC